MVDRGGVNLNKQEYKDNVGVFIKGKGYMKGDHLIAPFEPFISGRYIIKDLASEDSRISYEVKVRTISGDVTQPNRYSNFDKIDYFSDFKQNSAGIRPADMKALIFKLQEEALFKNVPTITVISATSGFYTIDEEPVMVIADKAFVAEEASVQVDVISPYRWRNTLSVDIKEVTARFLEFMPGVTEPLFYASMSAVVQPILIAMGIIPDYLTALIGPSGCLKTTLNRLYSQWIDCPSKIERLFDDKIGVSKLEDDIYAAAGLCFTFDDYHKKSSEYGKKKYRERLDLIARVASANRASAAMFITAESISDECIFSCQDRMFNIYVPNLGVNLELYKRKISSLRPGETATVARIFVDRLISNFYKTTSIIQDFIDTFEVPDWCDVSTRLGHHIMIILLTERLFRYYMCDDDCVLSHLSSLDKALEVNGKKQICELARLKSRESEESYICILDRLIRNKDRSKDINIALTKKTYDESRRGAVYWDRLNNVCYITSNNLAYILSKELGRAISIKQVSSELHKSGVLIEDSDKYSVKFLSRRHYKIDCQILHDVCEAIICN